MLVIAHRANTVGAARKTENKPSIAERVMGRFGFPVELDVWYLDGSLYSGHCEPRYSIPDAWWRHHRHNILAHCKTPSAHRYMEKPENMPWDWVLHGGCDAYALTGRHRIFCAPGAAIQEPDISIVALPENGKYRMDERANLLACLAIVTNVPKKVIEDPEKAIRGWTK